MARTIEVRELLSLVPWLPSPEPVEEQVQKMKGLIAAQRWAVAQAPIDELAAACKQIVSVAASYVVIIDSTPYLSGEPLDDTPRLLCEHVRPDPASLACFAPLLVAAKHDAEIGDEITETAASASEAVHKLARIGLDRVAGKSGGHLLRFHE